MAIAGLHLTIQEHTTIETMAQHTGKKTPDELMHDAVKHLNDGAPMWTREAYRFRPEDSSQRVFTWMSHASWRSMRHWISRQYGTTWRPSPRFVPAERWPGRSVNLPRARASTGSLPLGALSSRYHRCTRVAAQIQPQCLSTCLTRWYDRLVWHLLRRRVRGRIRRRDTGCRGQWLPHPYRGSCCEETQSGRCSHGGYALGARRRMKGILPYAYRHHTDP